MREIRRNLLVSLVNVAFEHKAANRPVPVFNLREAIPQHEGLQRGILKTVGVRAVDDEAFGKSRGFQGLFRQKDAHGIKVRAPAAAPEHQVAVGVAARQDDRTAPVFVHPQKVMRRAARLYGVD